jgi:hypothetical protein
MVRFLALLLTKVEQAIRKNFDSSKAFAEDEEAVFLVLA